MCAQRDPGMELSEDNHARDEFTLQIETLMDLVILASSLKTLTGKKKLFKCKFFFMYKYKSSQTFVTF